jgi:hypothetical protein
MKIFGTARQSCLSRGPFRLGAPGSGAGFNSCLGPHWRFLLVGFGVNGLCICNSSANRTTTLIRDVLRTFNNLITRKI